MHHVRRRRVGCVGERLLDFGNLPGCRPTSLGVFPRLPGGAWSRRWIGHGTGAWKSVLWPDPTGRACEFCLSRLPMSIAHCRG